MLALMQSNVLGHTKAALNWIVRNLSFSIEQLHMLFGQLQSWGLTWAIWQCVHGRRPWEFTTDAPPLALWMYAWYNILGSKAPKLIPKNTDRSLLPSLASKIMEHIVSSHISRHKSHYLSASATERQRLNFVWIRFGGSWESVRTREKWS